MKVLLLGEFSSLHRYLKEGLQELGIDARLFANGDGWKKIGGADGTLFDFKGGVVGRVSSYLDAYKRVLDFLDYDVVQLINSRVYPGMIAAGVAQKLAKQNKCLSLVAAGDDLALVKAYKSGAFDYYCFDHDKVSLGVYNDRELSGKKMISVENKIIKASSVIIPSLYEYSV